MCRHQYGNTTKWRSTIAFWTPKAKEQRKRSTKRKYVQITKCLKKTLDPTYFFKSHIFLIFFLCQSKSYGFAKWSSLNSKGTKAMSKEFKLKSQIVLMNPSLNVKSPSFEHMYFPHLKKNNLHGYGCTKWRFTIPFLILKVTKDCPKILSF